MTQAIIVCILSIVSFAAVEKLSTRMFAAREVGEAKQPNVKDLAHFKTRQVSVPVLNGGQIKGYLLVQIGYTREKDADKTSEVFVESVILDETLGYLFPKAQAGSSGVDKLDMEDVRKTLLGRVQSKIPDKKVVELRFNEFTFLNRSEAK